MPASLRVDDRLLVAVRRQDRIDLYGSADGGRTWSLPAAPVEGHGGNPPALTDLRDGRLCLTCGYRGADDPGIRATLSDDGRT
jgi:predicted neuraminidase